MKEKRIVRFCAMDKPTHSLYHILLGRNLLSITSIIRKKNDVFRFIAPVSCESHVKDSQVHAKDVSRAYEEFADFLRITYASAQFVLLASIIYANLRGQVGNASEDSRIKKRLHKGPSFVQYTLNIGTQRLYLLTCCLHVHALALAAASCVAVWV